MSQDSALAHLFSHLSPSVLFTCKIRKFNLIPATMLKTCGAKTDTKGKTLLAPIGLSEWCGEGLQYPNSPLDVTRSYMDLYVIHCLSLHFIQQCGIIIWSLICFLHIITTSLNLFHSCCCRLSVVTTSSRPVWRRHRGRKQWTDAWSNSSSPIQPMMEDSGTCWSTSLVGFHDAWSQQQQMNVK